MAKSRWERATESRQRDQALSQLMQGIQGWAAYSDREKSRTAQAQRRQEDLDYRDKRAAATDAYRQETMDARRGRNQTPFEIEKSKGWQRQLDLQERGLDIKETEQKAKLGQPKLGLSDLPLGQRVPVAALKGKDTASLLQKNEQRTDELAAKQYELQSQMEAITEDPASFGGLTPEQTTKLRGYRTQLDKIKRQREKLGQEATDLQNRAQYDAAVQQMGMTQQQMDAPDPNARVVGAAGTAGELAEQGPNATSYDQASLAQTYADFVSLHGKLDPNAPVDMDTMQLIERLRKAGLVTEDLIEMDQVLQGVGQPVQQQAPPPTQNMGIPQGIVPQPVPGFETRR